MKTQKAIVVGLAMAIIFGTMGYERLFAESKAAVAGPTKIAVASVRTIFQNCKKNADYKAKMEAETNKISADLEKIKVDLNILEDDLRKRKPNTADYLEAAKKLSEKKAYLEGQKQYYMEEVKVRDQIWTEKMYTEILTTVGKIAKQKGYDLVLEKDDPELPASTPTELMLIIRTHKVLYNSEHLDITSEVLAAIDAQGADTEAKPTK